jgi:hypothetical protein
MAATFWKSPTGATDRSIPRHDVRGRKSVEAASRRFVFAVQRQDPPWKCRVCEPPLCGGNPAMESRTSAFGSVFGRRGESPLQARALRPVTESNCVAARRGGKQLEVNEQSVTQVNSIRPCRPASLLVNGEARTDASRKPVALRGSVQKRRRGRWGGWRRNARKARHVNQRELPGPRRCSCARKPPKSRPAEVRDVIVATKPGNSGGAKGVRKMDVKGRA